jgi:hypothetical protein
MTQFHKGQEVEVTRPPYNDHESRHWRKAGIVSQTGHWDKSAPMNSRDVYKVQFPDGTHDVFDSAHIRERFPLDNFQMSFGSSPLKRFGPQQSIAVPGQPGQEFYECGICGLSTLRQAPRSDRLRTVQRRPAALKGDACSLESAPAPARFISALLLLFIHCSIFRPQDTEVRRAALHQTCAN